MEVRAFKLITGELVLSKSDGKPNTEGKIKLSKPQTMYIQQDPRTGNQTVQLADFVPFIKGDDIYILASTIQVEGIADDQLVQGYTRATSKLELPPQGPGIIIPS